MGGTDGQRDGRRDGRTDGCAHAKILDAAVVRYVGHKMIKRVERGGLMEAHKGRDLRVSSTTTPFLTCSPSS